MTITDHPTARELLATILAEPAADAPRMVLADWLEEHGDDARAAFIRCQIELARMDAGGVDLPDVQWGQRRKALAARERELLHGHGARWASSLGKTLGLERWGPDGVTGGPTCPLVRWKWSRGFIGTIEIPLALWIGGECQRCDGAGWHDSQPGDGEMNCFACGGTGRTPAHGPAIVAAHPVERVEVTDRQPYHARRSVQWYESRSPRRDAHRLPSEIFALLTAEDDDIGCCYYYGSQSDNYGDLSDAEAKANTDLSQALLAWARQPSQQPSPSQPH